MLACGLTSITISTAGFDETVYKRVYGSQSYERMKLNLTQLVKRNFISSESP